ncbi:hypothetical protein PHET_10685 [Paragonimus heterotremus]|uniref:Leishmanolysin-like peptidase n=1 Tax=Paragonimus heterotremus TaxID=100268 RepID=A0A8J4WD05_9TREM|nr:hypothetical protein PHET_10685 [Paragonimus heterotremus]
MPFCTWPQLTTPACHPQRLAYGYCDIRQQTGLSDLDRSVDDPWNVDMVNIQVAGASAALDYCPTISVNESLNYAMESFGEHSICVDHIAGTDWNLKQQNGESVNLDSFGASCHEHECHPEKGLTLRFGNYTVVCPFVGGNVRIAVESVLGHLGGYIYCPPCSSVCEFYYVVSHSGVVLFYIMVPGCEIVANREVLIMTPLCSSAPPHIQDTFCDSFNQSVDVELEEDLIVDEEMMGGEETPTQVSPSE